MRHRVWGTTRQANFQRRQPDIKAAVLERMIGQLEVPVVGEEYEVRYIIG